MYVMVGYQAAVSFNFTEVISKQAAHIAACIDFARTKAGPSKVLHVKMEKEKWWVGKCIENRGKTNYSENCTPGYYNFEGQTDRPRQNGVYGGGQIEYNEQMENVANAIPEFFDMA